MKLWIACILVVSSTVNAGMTEQQCKPQATIVTQLLESVERGEIPVSEEVLAQLREAKALADRGEYCAARTIILSLRK